jgi:hypothetical protein
MDVQNHFGSGEVVAGCNNGIPLTKNIGSRHIFIMMKRAIVAGIQHHKTCLWMKSYNFIHFQELSVPR